MDMFELIYWNSSYTHIAIINLAIVILIFASLRVFAGFISHTNSTKELAKKDNTAFGISLTGAIFSLTIVLSGAIYGGPVFTFQDSIIGLGIYGAIGIVLMGVTRLIFDRYTLTHIHIGDEIAKGNNAAAIVDAGNMIATALVIRAVMVWVESNTLDGIKAVLLGYIISQILLTAASYARVKLYSIQNNGKSLEDQFKKKNSALAIRYAGRRIGIAFAITAASNIMAYEVSDIHILLLVWTITSIVMMFIVSILSFIAQKIILSGIDVEKEITNQKNLAVGITQCIIYISIALLLAELMA